MAFSPLSGFASVPSLSSRAHQGFTDILSSLSFSFFFAPRRSCGSAPHCLLRLRRISSRLRFVTTFSEDSVIDQMHLASDVCGPDIIQLWVPFFNLVSFVLGVSLSFILQGRRCRTDILPQQTYFNTKMKRLRKSAKKDDDGPTTND